MAKKVEVLKEVADTPVKGKDEKPDAAKRTALVAKLRERGIPAQALTVIVSNGKSRRQIVVDLIAYVRTLPKAR